MVVGAATFVTDSTEVDAKDKHAVTRTGCLDRGRESESSDGHLSVLAPPIIFNGVVVVIVLCRSWFVPCASMHMSCGLLRFIFVVLLLAVIKWIVGLLATPESMQQHRQLSRNGHGRSFLRVFPSARAEFQPPSAQVAILAKGPEHVLRALNQ